ncbi:ribosome maturation protein RimP [Knoellia subterranea KCTC 19937]|uniref:Ribosome maturation factor RimP n=1 Tax=Knoellia subterranea KCTC 19937 TaxID=1385521 RepID=A0A0A0JI71_9MICO|nr:ribosome maturation protein RimP [Knoellia subterranea KCTC 19937]
MQELIDSALRGSGVVLEEVVVTPAGRRRVVKVVVDRELTSEGDITQTQSSLSLDEIAEATRTLSDALDESDVLGEQPYTLEVTSPGVSRPLTAPGHFRRNVGRLVELTPRDGERVTGRITRASVDDLTLTIPAVKKNPARDESFAYAAIDHADVQVEFSRKDDAETDLDPTAADADASTDKEN